MMQSDDVLMCFKPHLVQHVAPLQNKIMKYVLVYVAFGDRGILPNIITLGQIVCFTANVNSNFVQSINAPVICIHSPLGAGD